MDEDTLERAKRHIEEAREGRRGSRIDAALERARTEIESLASAAADLETGLPDRISEAVQEGLRREVSVVGRNLAEIRGLLNNAIRRLERLEQEVLAERHARIDDLALLVDLVSVGWRSVDARLEQIERPPAKSAHVLPLAADAAA
jgi:signal transduction histidine kinase